MILLQKIKLSSITIIFFFAAKVIYFFRPAITLKCFETIMMTMSSKIMSEIKEKFYAFYYTDKLKLKVPLKKTGHRGVCCNPCNWDGRYWMPTMVGNP